MTKTVYLVRHGQTFFNFYHKVQGRCDSPLNETGIRQVEATRDYFKKKGIKFDKAFSSTQERASDTLEIITDRSISGIAEKIDDNGSLIVKNAQNKLETISTGEVVKMASPDNLYQG